MDYYRVREALQAVINATIPLSKAQRRRIRDICEAVLLARSSQISWLARRLVHTTQKDSRIQWLSRVLTKPYLHQDYVYGAFVKAILAQSRMSPLHVLMDRTVFTTHEIDLLSISFSFRKRAIPIAWTFMDHGMSDFERQKQLIDRCCALLPFETSVVFHGDNEFGSVALMRYMRDLGWDFIVGQSSKNYHRSYPNGTWQPFSALPVTRKRAVYVEQVEVTKEHQYGMVNIFGFYKPRFGKKHRRQHIIYCATSLPITPSLRRVGHRRWGVECQFQDMKSSGWNIQHCDISHPGRREGLLNILNLCYLWATCLGRWLCKTSQRHLVDTKPDRRLSLFRMGWDWLVNQYSTDRLCPALSTLYQ